MLLLILVVFVEEFESRRGQLLNFFFLLLNKTRSSSLTAYVLQLYIPVYIYFFIKS